MDKDELESLLDKYQQGKCSPEEKKMVEAWYEIYDSRPEHGLSISRQEEMYALLSQKISEEGRLTGVHPAFNKRKAIVRAITIAASVIFLACSAFYFLNHRITQQERQANRNIPVPEDLLPGGQKATLTLGDGSVIKLDDAKDGTLAHQGNVRVVKLTNGQLAYRAEKKTDPVFTYNTIQTPRGGAYQVILPDGSQVWLNSASSIKFPTVFASGERKIELTGEAYFEIAHDASKPFLVELQSELRETPGCTIEVLGTHFNVMAYPDEDLIRTTLIEGSIKLSGEHLNRILRPGQQAGIKPDYSTVTIQQADIDETMAWKNNLFWFNQSDINAVMRQVSRWYDVDVRYEGKVSKIFKGSVPRNLTAAKLFDILERTGGVHFKISGKQVIVMP